MQLRPQPIPLTSFNLKKNQCIFHITTEEELNWYIGSLLQDSPVGSAESSGSSGLAMRPMDLGMATIRQQLASSSAGSAPTSPKTGVSCLASNSVVLQPQTHPLNLAGGAFQRPSHTNVELLRAAYR